MTSLKKQWFSIAIIACILLAYIFSKVGLQLPEILARYTKFLLIFCIFLLSGLSIETEKLVNSIRQWQAHLFIQIVSFFIFPLIVIATGNLFNFTDAKNSLYIGFIVLACIPTTITSCVVFTNNAGGNQECSLFNATMGNLLGIFLTPLLILVFLGENIQVDVWEAIRKLIGLVFVPFLIGQLLHNLFAITISSRLSKLGSNWMILGIMLIAFIGSFQQGFNLKASDLIWVLILSIILHLLVLALCWYGTAKMESIFSLSDRKCITITASQKTLGMGLPMIAILFANNPNLALISLPVIFYHTVQLFIDGIVVGIMAEQVE